MKETRYHLYEGMFIISATLSEDARKKGLEKITSFIETAGGEIKKLHEMGRKRLAYPINDHREGHYFLAYYTMPSQAVDEFWKDLHLHEDLVRFITLRTEAVKESLEYKALARE